MRSNCVVLVWALFFELPSPIYFLHYQLTYRYATKEDTFNDNIS